MKYFLSFNSVDEQKTAKKIANMFVDGKILYCSPPPGIENSNEFNNYQPDDPNLLTKVDIDELVQLQTKQKQFAEQKPVNESKYKMKKLKANSRRSKGGIVNNNFKKQGL